MMVALWLDAFLLIYAGMRASHVGAAVALAVAAGVGDADGKTGELLGHIIAGALGAKVFFAG